MAILKVETDYSGNIVYCIYTGQHLVYNGDMNADRNSISLHFSRRICAWWQTEWQSESEVYRETI